MVEISSNIDDVKFGIIFAISAVLFFIGLYYLVFHNKFHKNNLYSPEKRIVIFTGLLFCATWCIRYAVGLSGLIAEGLSRPEEIFNSFVHALQSFSMDENYSEYLTQGKVLVGELYGGSAVMIWLYALYTSFLNAICPVAGGAIIFAILTTIFPRVRLWVMSLMVWKPVCYFSELNDDSLALAMSIRSEGGNLKNALFIFSDVYADSDDEAVTERIQKAKHMNAVCLKDDISDITILKRKGKRFFLMDRNEIGSLRALSCFKDDRKLERLTEEDEIYLFGTDDSNQLVVRNVRGYMESRLGADNTPFIFSVKSIRSLVYNLLQDKPLFTALDKSSKDFHITIFGSGQIGTEMFLAAYWCGQMLDKQLHITVVSKERKNAFIARINHINPDIMETSNSDSDLLRIYDKPDSPRSPVYFSFDYLRTDIRQDDLYSKMLKDSENGRMIDSDYFVVALGSDQDNLEIADMIGRLVTVNRLSKPAADVPIAYVVYDDALNETLKQNADAHHYAADMYPFGSRGETFNYTKVVLEGIREKAKSINNAYLKAISDKTTDEKALRNMLNDPYSYWANITRAIHIQYKAYSVHMTTEKYAEEAQKEDSALNQNDRLAWLEHRRWNAFMRSRGFREPSVEEEQGYVGRLPDARLGDKTNRGCQKSIPLKIHPCIVECDENGKRKDLFEKLGDKDASLTFDRLDSMSRRFSYDYIKKGFEQNDYKIYDYPFFDF